MIRPMSLFFAFLAVSPAIADFSGKWKGEGIGVPGGNGAHYDCSMSFDFSYAPKVLKMSGEIECPDFHGRDFVDVEYVNSNGTLSRGGKKVGWVGETSLVVDHIVNREGIFLTKNENGEVEFFAEYGEYPHRAIIVGKLRR